MEIYNNLKFKNNKTGEWQPQEFEMIDFKYITHEEDDLVLNGTFCFALTYEDYVADCRDAFADKYNITTMNWIVANPFNKTNSNYMIANATNYTESRIRGLIFISD